MFGYLKMGDPAEAKIPALKATTEQPGYHTAHQAMAAVAATEKDYPAAVNYYLRAIELKPDAHVAQYECARLLDIMGRTEEPLAHAKAAVNISPSAEYQAIRKALIEKSTQAEKFTGKHEEEN